MAHLVRRDPNHHAIKQALMDAGRPVKDVSHYAGLGCDLLTEHLAGYMVLLEVKDGTKPPSARRLTDSEKDLRARFPRSFVEALSVEDALRAVGLLA
jgi:hypothetical protein